MTYASDFLSASFLPLPALKKLGSLPELFFFFFFYWGRNITDWKANKIFFRDKNVSRLIIKRKKCEMREKKIINNFLPISLFLSQDFRCRTLLQRNISCAELFKRGMNQIFKQRFSHNQNYFFFFFSFIIFFSFFFLFFSLFLSFFFFFAFPLGCGKTKRQQSVCVRYHI